MKDKTISTFIDILIVFETKPLLIRKIQMATDYNSMQGTVCFYSPRNVYFDKMPPGIPYPKKGIHLI